MAAKRAALVVAALAALAPSARAAYSFYPGYVPAGDDVGTLPAGTTVAAAQAACTANPACAAFTYDGPRGGPIPGTCYLKNATGWANFEENATSTWSTYARAFGPCDLFAAGGTPCAAAHSVVRALYADYAGALYQVNRSSDNTVLDIGVGLAGIADAAAQDAFCAGTACTISMMYDQSERLNHLAPAPAGGAVNRPDLGVNASRFPFSLGGSPAYAAYFENLSGYRRDNTSGIAVGNEEATYYMVTSGQHANDGCCFDCMSLARRRAAACTTRISPITAASLFLDGNAEIDNHDDGAGTMEAVYWGTCTIWGKGTGEGPWVMADLENGESARGQLAPRPCSLTR